MGDDDLTVVVPPAPPAAPAPSPAELWHAEHEARHREHMAHLESIREEHRSEVNRLEERISTIDGVVAALALEHEPVEPVDARALDEALETVERVGETIAHVTEAVVPEEVSATPPPPRNPSSNGPTGPTGEVEPDVTTAASEPANAARGNRRKGWW